VNVGKLKAKAKTKDKRDNVSFEEIVKCGHCPRQWMLSTFSWMKSSKNHSYAGRSISN
jgi:hypothetical protein